MIHGQIVGLIAAAAAFAAALGFVPMMRALAVRLDMVDRPGGRKQQSRPVPLFGGVGALLAAIVGVWIAIRFGPKSENPLSMVGTERALIAGGIMFLTGLVDDIFKDKVGPGPKFLCQCAAVLVLFFPFFLRAARGDSTPGDVLHLACISLWFLTVVNAVNFVDNMNGLCAGLSMTSLLVGLFGLSGSADVRFSLMAGSLGGALAGFLPYNFPKARIYLGDAGSHLAGFFLALLSLEFTGGFMSKGSPFFGLDAFIPAMLVLGIPLFDLLFSVVRRYRERRPIFHGDARHLSHRLVGAGLDRASAVMLLWGVHVIVTALGVIARTKETPGRWGIVVVVLVFLGILAGILVRVERRRNPALANGTLDPDASPLADGDDASAGSASDPTRAVASDDSRALR